MLGFRAGINKILVRIANRVDLDKTDLGLPCLSRPFWQATNVRNFRASDSSYLRMLQYQRTVKPV